MRLLSGSAASMAAGGRRTLDDADDDADDLEAEEDAEEDAGEEDGDYVPEELAEEEARLRSGRAAAGAGFADEQQAPVSLSESRFKKLDVLLERTGLYSQFLSEQMNAIVEEVDADANARAAGAGKRKGPESGPPPKGKKRARGASPSAGSPTRELLPLLTGGEMREYQLKGVKWLISLYQNGLNGILADQMGLGKTVQCIGFLSHLFHKGVSGPHIVLAPLSTLSNWEEEFARWAPSIPCLLYHGDKARRSELQRTSLNPKRAAGDGLPVVITSYEILIADIKFFQGFDFKYIVVDEGHRLKNFDCKLIRELRTLRSANKLLLTGTPLQNSLAELWSLMNFVMPEVFSNLGEFEAWFDFSGIVGNQAAERGGQTAQEAEEQQRLVEQQRRNQVVSKLHGILQPFVLRRVKADVEDSLPRKKEIVLYAQMTPRQRKLNDILSRWHLRAAAGGAGGAARTAEELEAELRSELGGYFQGRLRLNNMLMQLRKIANHPDLITGAHDGSPLLPAPEENRRMSGKMRLLDRMMGRLRRGGHKVLIFSQMTSMIDLLESHLDQQGITTYRLDGGVPYEERRERIAEFNARREEFSVFLLSTRAGGLGINLTAADTAIIYDSDWNPHQDLQAMDRCHRIGQTRPVHVYRMACAHSVEGRLLQRANEKIVLDRVVMKQGAFREGLQDQRRNASLSQEELRSLLEQDLRRDGVSQSRDISDADLDRVMDRSDLVGDGDGQGVERVGAGFEIPEMRDSANLLSGVDGAKG